MQPIHQFSATGQYKGLKLLDIDVWRMLKNGKTTNQIALNLRLPVSLITASVKRIRTAKHLTVTQYKVQRWEVVFGTNPKNYKGVFVHRDKAVVMRSFNKLRAAMDKTHGTGHFKMRREKI